MALEPYKTKGGLTLLPPHKDEDEYVCVLHGDRDKEYFRGSLAAATAAFKKEIDHYKEAEA